MLPALVLASQIRLDNATSCLLRGRLRERRSLRPPVAIDILGTRAAPWQIEALCAVRANHYHAAESLFAKGLAHDPNDWQLQAGLAAARAAVGLDARAQAAQALRLNPLDPGVQALASALARRAVQARAPGRRRASSRSSRWWSPG